LLIHRIVTENSYILSNPIRGEVIMKKILTSLIAAFAAGLLVSMPVYAAGSHLDEALEHSAEAVVHGEEGHTDELLEHSKEAVEHAEASRKAGEGNFHTDHGISHLKDAIKSAEEGNIGMATTHAKEAITHLKASGADADDGHSGHSGY
jgi:hypothetical protein